MNTVFVKGNLLKLSSFGVSAFSFEGKEEENDFLILDRFLLSLKDLLESVKAN